MVPETSTDSSTENLELPTRMSKNPLKPRG